MTSVGYNFTIGEGKQIYIESHIFDFDEDIYDQPIEIKWYKYMRGEIKFKNLDELKRQLEKDETTIKSYFKKNKS